MKTSELTTWLWIMQSYQNLNICHNTKPPLVDKQQEPACHLHMLGRLSDVSQDWSHHNLLLHHQSPYDTMVTTCCYVKFHKQSSNKHLHAIIFLYCKSFNLFLFSSILQLFELVFSSKRATFWPVTTQILNACAWAEPGAGETNSTVTLKRCLSQATRTRYDNDVKGTGERLRHFCGGWNIWKNSK